MEAAVAHPLQWELVAQQVWRHLRRRVVGAVWGGGQEGVAGYARKACLARPSSR